MKKRLLVAILATTAAICGVFGLTACGDNTSDSGSNTEQGESTQKPDENQGGNEQEPDDGKEEVKTTEGLQYTLFEEESYYRVSGIGTATDTDIVIPSEYKGLPVLVIGWGAFSGCSELESVSLPDSIITVEARAFNGCTKLIQSENGVQYVDNWVISCDTSLTEITLRSDTKGIALGAFVDCNALTSIRAGENSVNYKSIDGNLYSKDGKTFIYYALGKTATSFTVPDSVTDIRSRAFECCGTLKNITISDSVTNVDSGAFGGCSALTSITVGANSVNYKSIDGNLYSKDGKTLIYYASGKTATSFNIPDGVTWIGISAFGGCDALTSVSIPDSVVSIGSNAFSACYMLSSITIPDSVKEIGNYAFFMCTKLTSISIPGCVTSMGSSVLSGCFDLKSVTLGKGIKSIRESFLSGCSELESVSIPDSVVSIGSNAFSTCSALTDIHFSGTKEQWQAIEKSDSWDRGAGNYTVHCSDGNIVNG